MVQEERATFMLSFIWNYVFSVRWGLLILLVLVMGCVFLLLHSQGHQYDYFGSTTILKLELQYACFDFASSSSVIDENKLFKNSNVLSILFYLNTISTQINPILYVFTAAGGVSCRNSLKYLLCSLYFTFSIFGSSVERYSEKKTHTTIDVSKTHRSHLDYMHPAYSVRKERW